MISLADLSALHEEHKDALNHPVEPVTVDGVTIGDDEVALMGCVNLSQDSWYRISIAVDTADAIRLGRVQAAEGAAIIDLGAEASDAAAARVGATEQERQLVPVVEALAEDTLVSVESYQPSVVRACLAAGARVLNLTGREHEDEMLTLAAEYDAMVVLCYGTRANVREDGGMPLDGDPFPTLVEHFGSRLEHARSLGVDKLVIDPGLGFHYRNLLDPMTRARFQMQVLAQSFRLRPLGVPVLNVLPNPHNPFGDQYRMAEGFYGVFAALGGSHVLRVHEVPHLRVMLSALDRLTVR